MKTKRIFWLWLISGFLIGCSNDDATQDLEPSSQIPDFMVVGEDVESIFQYNYDAFRSQGDLINLTEENNVDRQYLTLRQVDELVTFFSFSSGNFSAIQRDAVTGDYQSFDNFYTVSQERSIIWGSNSENQLFLGFYSPRGTTNYGIRIIDAETSEAIDLPIDVNILRRYEPLYYKERLLIPFRDAGSNYHTAIIDTENQTILKTLDFGSSAPSLLISNNDDLVIITNNNDNNYEYTTYDLESLEVITNESFVLDRFLEPGPLQAQLIDRKLYYLNSNAQPSPVPLGPAVYDFNTGENRIIDMITIVQAVELEKQINIDLTAFDYVVNSGTFLIGYVNSSNLDALEGGVLIISDKGALLNNIDLRFVPTHFIKQ